ncbi:MAG TPA: glycerophosphodiester phosphodiesterase [Chitinophagales bacterium]|nr:glycerophosphodiester phosphodiesterase [Chitinophagales bacterium]
MPSYLISLINPMRNHTIIIAVIFLLSCCQFNHTKPLDIQGHRGARGLFPENTIPAFVYAAELGVTTLEMDVVVSADGKLVVSHEPWMAAEICSHPDGKPVSQEEEMSLNLYKMTYDSIARYDCGSRGNARFPQQQKIAVPKPLLTAVFDTVENLVRRKNLNPVQYNIETKSMEDGDNFYHPAPVDFVKLLLDEIKKHRLEERVTVQSFDVRTLQHTRRLAPEIKLALLADSGTFSDNVDKLGFIPDIYSPDYHLVNESLLKEVRLKGIQIIPWTVNDTTVMIELLNMGVDGIITDYPHLALQLCQNQSGGKIRTGGKR